MNREQSWTLLEWKSALQAQENPKSHSVQEQTHSRCFKHRLDTSCFHVANFRHPVLQAAQPLQIWYCIQAQLQLLVALLWHEPLRPKKVHNSNSQSDRHPARPLPRGRTSPPTNSERPLSRAAAPGFREAPTTRPTPWLPKLQPPLQYPRSF